MSSYSVMSKKNRLKLGIAVVVIIHIGFFYGFWHVKAGQIGNKVVELDIYGNTTTDGFSYYQALPDANCLDVVHEQLAKPPLQLKPSIVSTSQNAPTSEEVDIAPLPIQPARAPKCKKPTPLPDGYKKLGNSGFVGLEVNLNKTGEIVRGEVDRSSGFPDLDKAALKQVVETWAFEPCKKGEESVACKQYIKFRWKEAK
jgi:TonB family protein